MVKSLALGRLWVGFRHGHRKATALVAGVAIERDDRTVGTRRPINGDWLETYAGQVLVPELKPIALLEMRSSPV